MRRAMGFSQAAIGLAAAIVVALIPVAAQAQLGGRDWVERNYETRGPQRGYSGFYRVGPRNYWCDYQRLPNRKCTIGRDGRERCRITNWTLKQYCY